MRGHLRLVEIARCLHGRWSWVAASASDTSRFRPCIREQALSLQPPGLLYEEQPPDHLKLI